MVVYLCSLMNNEFYLIIPNKIGIAIYSQVSSFSRLLLLLFVIEETAIMSIHMACMPTNCTMLTPSKLAMLEGSVKNLYILFEGQEEVKQI